MFKKFALGIGIIAVLGMTGCEEDSAESGLNPCPDGTQFDAASGGCTSRPVNDCKDGTVYDAVRDACLPVCSKGQISTESDPCICPEGQEPDETNGCREKCDDGRRYDAMRDACLPVCSKGQISTESDPCICPEGQEPDETSGCREKCDDGRRYDAVRGTCLPVCSKGQISTESDPCICPEGQRVNDNNVCELVCGENERYDSTKDRCVKTHCELGYYLDSETGTCFKVCPCNQMNDTTTGECIIDPSMAPDKDDMAGWHHLYQRALQETAMAFYRKGDNIQYEYARSSNYIAPEDVTSQTLEYFVCSGFVYAVYYNALGIMLPNVTSKMNAYAYLYEQENLKAEKNIKHDDVIYFDRFNKIDTRINKESDSQECDENVKSLIKYLIKEKSLAPGDLVTWYDAEENFGHVGMIYELVEADGSYTDAYILDSSGTPEYLGKAEGGNVKDRYATTKLKDKLFWNSKINADTGVVEGTIKYRLFSDFLRRFNDDDGKCTTTTTELTVLRPAVDVGFYNLIDISEKRDGNYPEWKAFTEVEEAKFGINNSAYCRIRYPQMDIEKTANPFIGSTIEPGQTITYTIQIKNNSDEPYKNIYVEEYISKYVEIVNGAENAELYTNVPDEQKAFADRALAWHIQSIPAGDVLTISYTVKVKNEPENVGQLVRSSGSVAGVLSKRIDNVIAYDLSDTEKESLQNISSLYNVLCGVDNYNCECTDDERCGCKNECKYDDDDEQKKCINACVQKILQKAQTPRRTMAFLDALSKVGDRYKMIADAILQKNTERPVDSSMNMKNLFGLYISTADLNGITDNGNCNKDDVPYYVADRYVVDSETAPLIVSNYGNQIPQNRDPASLNIFLNNNHQLAPMVLNHFYSGVTSKYVCGNGQIGTNVNEFEELNLSNYEVNIKKFENSINLPDSRTDRQNMVYPETLKYGDVLIYANSNDITTWLKAKEQDGIYAYIFLGDHFHSFYKGVHNEPQKGAGNPPYETVYIQNGPVPAFYLITDNDAKDKERFKKYQQRNMYQRFGDLPALYGKDFFVILRPSLLKTSK